ncbi:MAG: hypothetical protein E6H09_09940 [Bacteroidetes bacterium]|jgi:hypothetical protein|nr:MAG: hypothetical protein E6H09_09940 [Bacteroidota bacterium]
MKNLFLLSAALLLFTIGFGANPLVSKPVYKASEVYVTLGSSGKMVSLLELSKMSIKDVQTVTGKKMKFAERLMFKVAQVQLKKSINHDGTINSDKITKLVSNKGSDVTTGFHLGGFALGLLLSFIGVIIAYLIKDDLKPARVKWAWIGAAISLLIWGAFAIF